MDLENNGNWRKYWELVDSGQIPQGLIVRPYGPIAIVKIDNVAATKPNIIAFEIADITTT